MNGTPMTDLLQPLPRDVPPTEPHPHSRWHFFRDVLVFQLKLVLGNLQNFLLLPVSLVAALIDLFIRGEREGDKFYWVLEWGRRTDEMINIYGSIGGYHATGGSDDDHPFKSYTVDTMLKRVEGAIVREYEKGGTAASIKNAVDRAIDEMQNQGDKHKSKFDDAVQRATDKIKSKMD
jgi:ribosome-associated translation inhibitor RaiA